MITEQNEQQKQQSKDFHCPFSDSCFSEAFVQAKLQARPFYKRHPWLSVFAGLLILFIFAGMLIDDKDAPQSDCLALVNIRGMLLNVESDLAWLDKLKNTKEVKGVLVRIDSPGGGVGASQELYYAVKALSEKMPVAIYMGSVAASGGLMVAMAGNKIFANPLTITGSIGVRMDLPQVGEIMQKIGIGQETLTTGNYKDAGSPMRPLSDEHRAYFQELIQAMHEQFVEIIATGRKLDKESVQKMANGKVYTGQQALDLGLVDVLGSQDAALEWLAQECKIPATQPLFKKKDKTSWLMEQLETLLDLNLALKHRQPMFFY